MRRRYRVRITLSGYILIALTVAVGMAAVNTGNNLLYLSAAGLLSLMTLSGLFSWFNLREVRVEIRPPEEVFCGLSAPFVLHLYGPRWPCFFLRLTSPYGETLLPYFRRRTRVLLWLCLPRRGRVRLETLSLSSGYPLGFFRRTRYLSLNLTLTVYPRPYPGPVREIPGEEAAAFYGGDSADSGEPEDLSGLEPYREGVPASRIAWRASARTGGLLVKEFAGPSGRKILIDLGHPTEIAISRATHRVLSALARGMEVGLRLRGEVIPPGKGPEHRKRLLEALAHA